MKLFLLLTSLAISIGIYSNPSVNNLNELMRQNSFTQKKETLSAVKAGVPTDKPEKKLTKEKDFFSQAEKTYKDEKLSELNKLFKREADFLLISEYIDNNIKSLGSKDADQMLLMFENYYYSIPSDSDIFVSDEELMDKKFGAIVLEESKKYNNDYTILIKNYKNVSNEELSLYLKSLYDRNLNLTYSNGYFFFTVNYNKLLTYEKYLSQNMINYLNYSDNEIRRPAVLNSKIVITLNDLADRILNAEKYIEISDNKDINKEFSKMLVFHFRNFILGVGDSPVFDSDTNTLNDNFLNSYKYYISKNGKFREDLQNYINELNQNKYYKSSNTYEKQINMINKVINSYNLKKEETFQ